MTKEPAKTIRASYEYYVAHARVAAESDGVYPVFQDKWGTETYEKDGATFFREVVIGQVQDYVESHKVLQPYIAEVMNYHFDRDFTYDEWNKYRRECNDYTHGHLIDWRTGRKIVGHILGESVI